MDSSAYLKKQGWLGTGTPLSENGLKNPLLVSKKVDVLGLGVNKHAAVSDQWWLRAFDEGLKNLGTGVQSTLGKVQQHGIHRGGLYGRFVKGAEMVGTIRREEVVQGTAETVGTMAGSSGDKKRKRADEPTEKRVKVKTGDGVEKKDKKSKSAAPAEPEFELRVKQLLRDAQMRGVVPDTSSKRPDQQSYVKNNPNAVSLGCNSHIASDPNSTFMPQLAAVAKRFAIPVGSASKSSLKSEKIARERLTRELKRAAKSLLLGEELPTEDELDKKLQAEKEAKVKRKVAAEGRKEQRAIEAREKQEREAKERDEHARLLASREARKAAAAIEGASQQDGLASNADEVALASHVNLKPGQKGTQFSAKQRRKFEKIALQRECTREEVAAQVRSKHQVRIDAASERKQKRVDKVASQKQQRRVAKAASAAKRLATSIVVVPPEKVEEYTKRAAEKGQTLQEYAQRRAEKYTIKHGIPPPPPAADALSFVIDTAGDATLLTPSSVDDGKFAPAPLDPSLWEGKNVKSLPKHIRLARKQWMAERRAARKARNVANAAKKQERESEGARKTKAQEAVVKNLLIASREAAKAGRTEREVQVEGVGGVPLVRVEGKLGGYGKGELKAARRVARRVLRGKKREGKAEKKNVVKRGKAKAKSS